MINFKPTHVKEDTRMWLICTVVGKDHDLIKKMKYNEDGTLPIFFSVGGVELDFNRVAERIETMFDEVVAKKAQELLDAKYNDLLNEIDDIQERIKEQRQRFKYDWED